MTFFSTVKSIPCLLLAAVYYLMPAFSMSASDWVLDDAEGDTLTTLYVNGGPDGVMIAFDIYEQCKPYIMIMYINKFLEQHVEGLIDRKYNISVDGGDPFEVIKVEQLMVDKKQMIWGGYTWGAGAMQILSIDESTLSTMQQGDLLVIDNLTSKEVYTASLKGVKDLITEARKNCYPDGSKIYLWP